jgi:hypothetical protein
MAPFLILFPDSSIRYQQVYDASQFAPVIPEGGWVTQIAFTVDGRSGQFFGTTLQAVQVNLSTTDRGPDNLSPVFTENIGVDETTVFGLGLLTLPAGQVRFDQVITFASPFFYSPTQGNLLLDVWNYEGYTPDPWSRPAYGAHEELGDSVSRIYSSSVQAESGYVDTWGLVTEFTIIPIPEPSTLLLGCLSILIILFRWGYRSLKGG